MFRCIAAICLLLPVCVATPGYTQTLQDVLQENQSAISNASRKTIDDALTAIIANGSDEAPVFLEKWREKEVWQREDDGLFFFVTTPDDETYQLIDITSGEVVGSAEKRALKHLRPNSGVRGVIAVALVQFQLSARDPARRTSALEAIERDPDASQLPALRGAIDNEPDPTLKARKIVLERLLTARFDKSEAARVTAISALSEYLSVETRAALNPMLSVKRVAHKVVDDVPATWNIADTLKPGSPEFSQEEAYAILVAAKLAPAPVSRADRNAALIANINDGMTGGVEVARLDTEAARDLAYTRLSARGVAPTQVNETHKTVSIKDFNFFDIYDEPSVAVTDAALATLKKINTKVAAYQTLDLALDGLSLASIYFLAAIGLAITFGVMGVINMAHGEFIMMGAYTGYVVQLFIPDYTLSLLVALPLAFAVTFGAGVAMERLVIRWLYNRPLETLLATFGISIALQQLAKNIFGTQARPLTSPGWLDGAWVMNDVVSISYIRIAIFFLGLIFLFLLLFILKRTRLGLEVRAVTQNPRMAASMGINPDRINMLTFGLGSGIAGIAGVAIGLYAKVTSELGADYIVQSFMTVVVGGVGNIWGTLLGATMIGFLQKGIEFFNPSNTLAAQTYMIIFIIIFIQFRPKGIFALKGRAAGD
jgi:urea transport system permease protein